MKTKLMCLLIFLSLFPTVSADISSISSSGSSETVIIPNEIIEGFFYGEIPSQVSGGGGGLPTLSRFQPLSLVDSDFVSVCRLSEEFITNHTVNGTLVFKMKELEILRQFIIGELNIEIPEQDFVKVIALCSLPSQPFKVLPFLFLLLLIVVVISVLLIKNKQNIILLYRRRRVKRRKKSTS